MDNKEEISRYSNAVHIAALINKVHEKAPLTEEEERVLSEWLREDQRHAALYERLKDRRQVMEDVQGLNGYNTGEAIDHIFGQLELTPARQTRRVFMTPRRLSAAVVFLLVAAGAWFFFVRQDRPVPAPAFSHSNKSDLSPGGNKAVLILADGTHIRLDSAANGQLALQGQAKVFKQESGLLAYDVTEEANHGEVFFNTVAVPRGGQYRLILADGSKVWLNAASSIRYPSAFTGKERTVEITGEAYFEIAKNAAMPFIVKVNDEKVEVLGTHFNVMAYNDEAEVKTTLLEGAVRVWKGDAAELLRPGQQAGVHKGGEIKVVSDADADEVLAWKNNLFAFNNDDIETVMRQVARWYDVDIKYEGTVTSHFSGNISRAVNVSQLFKMLELTGTVHFRIEGNYIVVNP